MRSKSDGYHHGEPCSVFPDCKSHYCHTHQLLWSECETMAVEIDGDYADGRAHHVYIVGDCPECEEEWRRRQRDEAAREYGRIHGQR